MVRKGKNSSKAEYFLKNRNKFMKLLNLSTKKSQNPTR